jgi:hypothetical protein
LRPTLNGEQFKGIFFCSFPCTNTSAGKTPEPELGGVMMEFKAIGWAHKTSPHLRRQA